MTTTNRPHAVPALQPERPLVADATAMSLQPTTFAELKEFATTVANSNLCPTAFKGKSDDVLVAMLMGADLGLKPLAAIQNIAVINGRPTLYGDGFLAVILAHPDCQNVIETIEGEGDSRTARCIVMRRGREPVTRTFSVADAKRAGLWAKAGPWASYPDRMLQMRARGFAGRDAFADALRGIVIAEEAHDTAEREVAGEVMRTRPSRGRTEELQALLERSAAPAAFVPPEVTPELEEKLRAAHDDPNPSVEGAADSAQIELGVEDSEPVTVETVLAQLRQCGSDPARINQVLALTSQLRDDDALTADEAKRVRVQASKQIKGG